MSETSPSESGPTVTPEREGPAKNPPRCLPFLAVLGILGLFCLGPTLSPSGHVSYAYLRSLFFDGDLNVTNEAVQQAVEWPKEISLEPDRDTGLPSTPASAGPGLFWTPFLFGAHVFVLALQMLGLPILADGYNEFYFLAINIGTFFYLAVGVVFAAVALQRLQGKSSSVALVLAGIGASPLLGGSVFDGSLPDALSFFGAAFFFYEWMEYRRYARLRNALMLGIAAGVLCLIRPVNVVLCPWPLVDLLAPPRQGRRHPYWQALWYVVALLIAVTPQLWVWYAQHGAPWPDLRDRPHLAVDAAGYLSYFFGWPGGFFVRYPFFGLAFLGLAAFTRRDRRAAGPLLACFLASLLTAGALSAPSLPREEAGRLAVSALPFAIVGVACLSEARWRISAPVVALLAYLSVVWTVFWDLFEGSFLVSPSIPETALMIPRRILTAGGGFGAMEALATVFLVVGVVAGLVLVKRLYCDITDPSSDLLFAHPGRRIGIWAVVILSADIVVGVADRSHQQILVPLQVGQYAYRVVPYTYNRFGRFKQVGLNLQVGPGVSRTLYFSPPHAINGLYLVTRVFSTRDIPWGTSVARLSVHQRDREESVLLEFGEETVGHQYREAERHFQGTAGLLEWRDSQSEIAVGCSCRLDLPRPVIADQLVVENLVADATLSVDGLGFRPSPIRVVPPDRLRSLPAR